MTPAAHALRVGAEKKVNDVLPAEALARAGDARKNFLCRDRRVGKAFDFVQTRIARFAIWLGIGLSEVLRKLLVTTMDAAAETAHMLQQFARRGDYFCRFFSVERALLDQRFPAQYIGGGIEQHAFRLQPITTSAAGFLLIMFDGLR